MKLEENQELITSINAVATIIKERPKTISLMYMKKTNLNARLEKLLQIAETKEINISRMNNSFFKNNFADERHQGVAIRCNKRSEENESYLQNLVQKRGNILLLLLDSITDPHNLGACIRSAAAAGVDAVIVPKNRACHLNSTVRKVSSGGSELIPFVIVINLVRTIEWLKKNGVRIIGTSKSAKNIYSNMDLKGHVGFVIGSEEKGLRRLVKENCDGLISIPMYGKMESLNASVSAGIVLFEYLKQNNHHTSELIL